MSARTLQQIWRGDMHALGQSTPRPTSCVLGGATAARSKSSTRATFAKTASGVPAVPHRRLICRVHASGSVTSSPESASTAIAVSQYLGKGPYTASPLPPIAFSIGQGRSGSLDCTMRVYLPNAGQSAGPRGTGQRWPLVVFSSGFLLHSSMYGSYAADLASWGLAVVLYDLPEVVDDNVMVSAIGAILDACTSNSRINPYIDPRAILLAGHSRGGKLSVLAAASDPRVKGIALLDPVDVTAMTPMGPGYPSALPAMRIACGPPRRVPALVVGAARNASVIPANANYKRFISSCPGACWSLELLGAGHLQFLDTKVDLFAAFVESGPASDEAVRRASKVALLTWALDLAVPLARGDPLSGAQVVERLQQATTLIERQTEAVCGLKGFDSLGGFGAATTGSSGSGTGAATNRSGPQESAGGASPAAASGTSASVSASSSSSTSRSGAASSDDASRRTEGAAGGRGAADSGSQSTRGAGNGGGSSRSSSTWSYEELLRMRARELKAILVERGIDCSDCFEKEDLARRIMERC